MDHVLRATFGQSNYRKMTLAWSFSYNSFVKFHNKNIWESQQDHVISKVFYKGYP